MDIKIINCSEPLYWYKDKINNVYTVIRKDGDNYVVDTPEEEFAMGSVLPQDADVMLSE